MYTTAALLDVHERTHRSLAAVMAHIATLPEGAVDREVDGVSYPSLRLQFHHVLGAEEYWIGVLQGRVEADFDDAAYPSIASLIAYRERTFGATRAFVSGASDDALNKARPMMTWGGTERVLVPAHVVLRTQTHAYQHQGEILSMCRRLDWRAPAGLDFPLS